ncbi:unnamed protein product [Adineta ricciae]|uniref:EF-hand domain-containing protein n=1 Tax=Adineta ricciae TaxID=249248 RepID=A0A814KAA5_ADIRI|nr:unnamed protein product [Adineta ricciae]
MGCSNSTKKQDTDAGGRRLNGSGAKNLFYATTEFDISASEDENEEKILSTKSMTNRNKRQLTKKIEELSSGLNTSNTNSLPGTNNIRHAFSLVDSKNNGSVYVKDIPTIFENLDESFKDCIMEEDELNRYLEEIDLENSDQISFTQFLVLLSYKINRTDTVEELQEAFRMFDRTESGYITFDNLWRGMHTLGENLSRREVEQMMQEADKDFDGKINFAEFIEMIRYK